MRVLVLVVAQFALSIWSLPAAAQLQALSPQLVVFAGSDANLQALANGLATGQPVTLVTQDASGLLQIATFTPPNVIAAAEVARTLEQARNNLIARGIAQPTAAQVATSLMGGPVLTSAGTVSLTGVLTNSIPQNAVQVRNEFAGSGAFGAAVPFGSVANFQALNNGLRQGTPITLTGQAANGSAQQLTFTAPGGPLSQADANLLLQIANQQLASLGIVSPTPAQIQAALMGGTVAVPGGNVQLAGVLQNRTTSTSNSSQFGTSNSPLISSTPGVFGTSSSSGSGSTAQPIVGSNPTVTPVDGVRRSNTAEGGANRGPTTGR